MALVLRGRHRLSARLRAGAAARPHRPALRARCRCPPRLLKPMGIRRPPRRMSFFTVAVGGAPHDHMPAWGRLLPPCTFDLIDNPWSITRHRRVLWFPHHRPLSDRIPWSPPPSPVAGASHRLADLTCATVLSVKVQASTYQECTLQREHLRRRAPQEPTRARLKDVNPHLKHYGKTYHWCSYLEMVASSKHAACRTPFKDLSKTTCTYGVKAINIRVPTTSSAQSTLIDPKECKRQRARKRYAQIGSDQKEEFLKKRHEAYQRRKSKNTLAHVEQHESFSCKSDLGDQTRTKQSTLPTTIKASVIACHCMEKLMD